MKESTEHLNIPKGPKFLRPFAPVQETNRQDKIHQYLLAFTGLSVVVLLILMLIVLTRSGIPAIKEFGASFLIGADWDPIDEKYGALTFIYGTVVTSFVALFMATPFSLGTALFVTQICPRSLRMVISFVIETLAAIPSIVYGMWALFFLAPFVRKTVTPLVKEYLSFTHFFEGPSFGIGVLTASIVLAIMISPVITAVATEVFKKTPELQKEGALALGATRWEMIWYTVFRPSLPGILGATILGLGRAFGETMAVAMVIGNKAAIFKSLLAPGATMASVIANEYAESSDDLHLGALSLIGLVLFIVSLFVNLISRLIVWKFSYGVKK